MPELTQQQRDLLNIVQSAYTEAEKLHAQMRPLWEERYRLYRTYQEHKAYLRAEPDRDVRIGELVSEWGANLRLPWAFATVETIVARQLTNRARMLYVPWDREAMSVGASGRPNVENMRMTIEAQQEQIRYLLSCQTTCKTGQIYGIGFRKTMWRSEKRDSFGLVKATGNNGFEWTTEPRLRGFDDPDSQDVDPFLVRWDPSADGIEDCEYIIQDVHRSVGYCMGKIREAQRFLEKYPNAMQDIPNEVPGWPLAVNLTEEDVRALINGQKWSEAWAGRDVAAGVSRSGAEAQRLTVSEYHDGRRVITVLGNEVPVRATEKETWHGELGWHIYRPSEVPHEFAGIGAIEPSTYLFYEMDLLRSQRRDMASIALSPVFAYRVGSVDPAHLKIAPGHNIPTIGEPSDVMQQMRFADVPSSGYTEEDRIRADIERATALNDAVLGSATTGGTATEAQLQLAAANVRIQNMTMRFEQEIIADECQQFVHLNQQHIQESRGMAQMVPAVAPQPGEPDHRWTWFEVTPAELQGEMFARCIGGSEANNVPQMRTDAQALMGLLGNPDVDQRKLLVTIFEKTGIERPEVLLAETNRVPPQTMDALMRIMATPKEQGGMGLPPEQAHAALQAALQAGAALEQQELHAGGQPGPAEGAGAPDA